MPDPPAVELLNEVEQSAQAELRRVVEASGGRFGSTKRIEVGHLQPLVELCDFWARHFGEQIGGVVHYDGVPGLWHALDDLYPLEDPNRWDVLRRAVTEELERRNWRRVSPPRGAAFRIELERPPGTHLEDGTPTDRAQR